MAPNPFRFGTPRSPENLVGRDQECAEITRRLHEGRNLCLIAPRGTGKTALLQAAAERVRQDGTHTVYVDLFPAISTRRFVEIYASALTLTPSSTVESMQEAVQQLVPTIVPRVTITGSGRPGLQLDLWDRERDVRALLERVVDAPAQMATTTGTPVVVIFDDLEDMLSVAEPDLVQTLAQAIRRQTKVGYAFVLRKETTAKSTFNEPKSPFYRLADTVRLDVVPDAEMVEGLKARFADVGIQLDDATLGQLVELAEGVPHYVMTLAHALYEETRESGSGAEKELREAVSHVLEAGAYSYKMQWDQLSPYQRNLVLAIASGHTERLHSQRIVFQLGLGSPSTVSKNLRSLADREILQRQDNHIRFVDPFFGLWLQRRMT